MKQLVFFFNLLLLSSSVIASQDVRDLESFTKLKVSAGITVDLVNSSKNTALISVQSGDTEDIQTTVSNGVLRIKWKEGTGKNRTANVTLNFTKIESMHTMAGGKVVSDELIQSNNLCLEAKSGGKINLQIDCTKLVVEVSSGSSITLEGKTKSQIAEASSGGKYKGEELVSESADVEASSGASVLVNVNSDFSAKANSGGSVRYKGNPANKNIDANKMSGGKVSSF